MNHPDITPGYYRIDGVDIDGKGRSYVHVTPSGTVWGLSVYDDGYGEGPTAEYRTMGWRLIDAQAVWPAAYWHPDHDRRAEVQAEHDARPGDYILVVEPATMARAQALGFEPGSGDALAWALAEVERLRLEAEEMRAERDRLARILAVERGDESQAPSGWKLDYARGVWRHGRRSSCGKVHCVGSAWTFFPDLLEQPALAYDAPTALEAMEAADKARRAGHD